MRTPWQDTGVAVRRPLAVLLIAIAIVAIAMTWPSPAPAEARPPAEPLGPNEFFLKIDGIEGESTAVGHQGELDIPSWSWGVATAGGLIAGRPEFTEVKIATTTSKASPQLMLACAQGKHFRTAILTARHASLTGEDPPPYLKITLNDVVVSSLQTSGANADQPPTEQLTLAFAQIVMEYRQQNADGSLGEVIRSGWDVKRNRPL